MVSACSTQAQIVLVTPLLHGDMKVTLQHQSTLEIILTAVLSALKRCTAVFVKTIKSLVGIKHVLDTRRPRRMRHDLDRNAGRM